MIPQRGIVRMAVAVLALLGAACASTEERPAAVTGSRWFGASTGTGGGCAPFQFDITADDNRITGVARTNHPWGLVNWDVTGVVSPEGNVELVTRALDARVGVPSVTWRGRMTATTLDLTLPIAPNCTLPRSARLTRAR